MSLLDSNLPIHEKALQLLEAAGYDCLEKLAQADPETLRESLSEANRGQRFLKKVPSYALMQEWIGEAQARWSRDSREMPQEQESVLVNFELDPEVVEMIAMAPLAMPLPGQMLAEKNVPVSEIPEAILLTAARGDVSMRVGTKAPEKPKLKEVQVIKTPLSHGGYVNTISFGSKKEEITPAKFRSTDEFLSPHRKSESIDYKAQAEERMKLMRAALPETNVGVDPGSRRYVRGVLHSHPHQLWWGAIFTVLCHILIPTGIFSAMALLLKDQGSSWFQWVPTWFLSLPLSVFVFGACYLFVSYSCNCRICGQKCFVPRNCLKNRKAHRVPLLGYTFAVALHMLAFRWFRCPYCGTPVRLKE